MDMLPQTRRARAKWGLAVGAVLAVAIARPLLAADLTGTWDISSRVGHDRQTITLEVVHDGATVTGAGVMRMDGAAAAARVAIRSAIVGRPDGSDFRIVLVQIDSAGARPQELIGAWYRHEMSGRVEGAYGSRMFWGVRRRTSD
jgi:hypothetical protein